jgi:hypothetical protein
MESGIPILTEKGKNALKNTPQDLSSLCRNILIQVDGKKTIDDLMKMFRGLKGLEESIEKIIGGNFVEISRQCKDLIKSLVENMLGPKAPTLIKKIDDLHAKYGDQCWEHLDEVDKLARMFYGEVVADNLKVEIAKILRETHK